MAKTTWTLTSAASMTWSAQTASCWLSLAGTRSRSCSSATTELRQHFSLFVPLGFCRVSLFHLSQFTLQSRNGGFRQFRDPHQAGNVNEIRTFSIKLPCFLKDVSGHNDL